MTVTSEQLREQAMRHYIASTIIDAAWEEGPNPDSATALKWADAIIAALPGLLSVLSPATPTPDNDERDWMLRCDFPGCDAEVEAWEPLRGTENVALGRVMAAGIGWTTDRNGGDFCTIHSLVVPPTENNDNDALIAESRRTITAMGGWYGIDWEGNHMSEAERRKILVNAQFAHTATTDALERLLTVARGVTENNDRSES